MNEINELEEFEHPYELEYSSAKDSKNESLKVKSIMDNEKNNFNYQNNTLFGINNNYIYQNSQSQYNKSNNEKSDMIIQIREDKNENNENYNNNFRLNNNIKKDIENLIEANKKNIKNNLKDI